MDRYSTEELVVLSLVISVFISIYVTAAAMLMVVIYIVKEKKLKSVAFATPGIKYLWALCALGVVIALINNNEIGILVAILMAVFFLIGAFARSGMTRMLFDKIIEISCVGSMFSFMVAFIQYLGTSDRTPSVFLNANYYAAVIEMIVLFAVYKLLKAENRKQRGFYAVVIAMNAAGLYFSGCRTAVFALFVAVSLMLLFHGRYKAFAAFSGLVILSVALMITAPENFPRFDHIDVDMGTRIAIWQRALENIVKHPVLGMGALAYKGFHFMVSGNSVVHTHSIYLEPILSFGIVGAVLILIYLKKNLLPIWKMRDTKADRDKFVLALGLLVSIALHGILDLTCFSVQTGVLLMLALTMAGIQENPQPVSVSPPAYHTVCLQKERQGQLVYASKNKEIYFKQDRLK